MRISDWSSDVCSSDLLWDVQTGRRLWSIAGTAYDFSQTYRPTISPDGRYALVSMPVGKGSVRETIALVSMADGSEIQRFNKPESYVFVLRFGPDGRSFSIDGSLPITTYRLASIGRATVLTPVTNAHLVC